MKRMEEEILNTIVEKAEKIIRKKKGESKVNM